MSSIIPREFAPLVVEGDELHRAIDAHLENWPQKGGRPLPLLAPLPEPYLEERRTLEDRTHRWFNRIYIDVLPYTTYDRRYLNILLRRALASICSAVYHEESRHRDFNDGSGYTVRDVESHVPLKVARQEAATAITLARQVIQTAAPIATRPQATPGVQHSHVPNTAFILMWMDPSHPELQDVHEAVKDVFAAFGIRAYRADDIQHQDRITDLVLEQITSAEFLFADLSGKRPNVYYEIGYAHALGKRPMLYRRLGTPLHFDLAVHNIPEYRNVTHLRELLRARLEAITGKGTPVPSGTGA